MKQIVFSLLFLLIGLQFLSSQCSILRIIEVDPSCGLDNGSITIVMDGTFPPYQYSIDNGITYSNNNVFTGLAAGDYVVRVVDGLGCVALDSPQLADSGFPVLTAEIDECLEDKNKHTITVSILGRDPFSFEWSNAQGIVSTDQDPGELDPGDYILVVTDNGGCAIDTSFSLVDCCKLEAECLQIGDEELACLEDLPEINPAFLDFNPDGRVDQDLLEQIGVQFVGIGACFDIMVTAEDVVGNGLGCEDSVLEIIRVFTMSDTVSIETCEKVYRIVDRDAPEIIDPAQDMQLTCGSAGDLNLMFEEWINSNANAQATDCNAFQWSTIPANPSISLDCISHGTTIVTFVATDLCGNVSMTEASFEVTDDSAPQISCPNDLIIECSEPDYNDLIQSWIGQTSSSDLCSQTIIDNDYNNQNIVPSCGNTFDVLFEARDECGKIAQCSGRILFVDTQSPNIYCPQNISLNIGDPNAQALLDNWLTQVSADDNCSQNLNITNDYVLGSLDLDCGMPGIYPVSFSTSDDCNQENSCQSNIILLAKSDGQINCPVDLLLECNSQDNDVIIQNWLNDISALDGNGSQLSVSNDFISSANLDCKDALVVNFNSIESCGNVLNCSATISFYDDTPPSLVCPSDLELVAQNSNNSNLITAWLSGITGNDDCTGISISNNFDSDNIYPECGVGGSFPVNFTVRDECNNESICTANINITHDASISLTCPQTLVLECGDPNNEGLIANWVELASATANVTGEVMPVSTDYLIGSTLSLGCGDQMPISFEALNECGDISDCIATIEMRDTGEPIISCIDELIINIEDLDVNVIMDWLSGVQGSDACSSITLINDFDPNDLDDFCNESIPVEFISTDACNNSSNCFSSYRIVDNQAPIVNCPPVLVISCTEDVESAFENLMAQISHSDNSGFSQAYVDMDQFDPAMVDCSKSYEFEIDVIAEDNCLNNALCALRIKVEPELKVYVPNVFSPNGDGINDRFTIYGNEFISSVAFLSVYDRWGNLVFTNEDFQVSEESTGWDGRFEDRASTTGVYTYVAQIITGDNGTEDLRGSVSIIR